MFSVKWTIRDSIKISMSEPHLDITPNQVFYQETANPGSDIRRVLVISGKLTGTVRDLILVLNAFAMRAV